MHHVQTILHIKVILLLAFEASDNSVVPSPRGLLSDDHLTALDQITPDHVKYTKRPNELSFYLDSYEGRKINLGFEAVCDRKGNWGISWAEQKPNIATQAWAEKYPTYESLMHSAKQWVKENRHEL